MFVSFLLSLLLTCLGLLLLLASLAGVVFGLYVAARGGTRRQGLFFALWWMPAAAASVGVIMRDPVTFVVGACCFVVGGVALSLEHRAGHPPTKKPHSVFDPSERTTQKRIRTRTQQERRAAS
jgi:hypothetical protein